MVVGLVIPANMKYSPYVNYYIDILKSQNIDYRTMIWDKTGIREDAAMTFSFKTSDFNRKKILLGHYLFAQKCKNYIRKERIDQLIIFTIAPLFFLGYRFLKTYSGKIVMDIRDDSPFRRRYPDQLKKIGNLADAIVVSSPIYSEWFDQKSILCHNADLHILKKYRNVEIRRTTDYPLIIAFAGMMIEEEKNIEVIEALANSEKYQLVFIGRSNEGKEKIEQFVKNKNISNVSFQGEYRKEEIVDIYRNNADLINILRKNTVINCNALPNKFYDAVMSGIPVLVYDHNKAISNYVKKYNLGIVLSEKISLAEQLDVGIKEFDFEKYKEARLEFLTIVQNDYEVFKEQLREFCCR